MKFHPQSNERINFFILHIHRTTSSEKEESFLKGNAWERAVKLGEYIAESKNTVRQTAAKFGISKSTVHKDVTERLKHINPSLYREVRLILEQNKQERHWRGGEATRQKYMQKRESRQTPKRKNTKN